MDLSAAILEGANNPLLLFGIAIILGALHGLEPGHSKTMMAAFIIAVRGSVSQAILLGLSAAFSHSIVVWILAAIALSFGNELIAEEAEPWFIMISGIIVLGIALWSFLQIRSGHSLAADMAAHHEAANDTGSHSHAAHSHGSHAHSHGAHSIDTRGHQSMEEIAGMTRQELALDPHAQAHANEIKQKFMSGKATTWQTFMFGLTGGLIPCSAAITVLILCLHLDKFYLGVGMVMAFSTGLAATLVAVGVVAAIGLRMVRQRSNKVDLLFKRAPYFSSVLIAFVGGIMIYTGYTHLPV